MGLNKAIQSLARDAVNCRQCFENSNIIAPFVDLAQPRWVGHLAMERVHFLRKYNLLT
jgi:hypothetical protein